MKIQNVELRDKTNRKAFYEFVCGDLVIGYLKKNSINNWTLYSELPNLKAMRICLTMDDGIILMKEILNEFIYKTTIEN